MSDLFDHDVLHRRVMRRLPHWSNHDFLYRQTAIALQDRLMDIKRDVAHVLDIGWQPYVLTDTVKQAKGIRDVETITPLTMQNGILPVTPHTYDAVISQMALHWMNDPALILRQYHFALQPDGVMIACLLGGDSFQELRAVLGEAEQEIYGGISPRVSPMMAVQDVAGLMQQSGFALPVVDYDRVIVTYKDLRGLLNDLRGLGQGNVLHKRRRQPVSRRFWSRVETLYRDRFSDERGRLVVTLDVIYALGWSPHPSQPQPKARGSATVQLGHALNG